LTTSVADAYDARSPDFEARYFGHFVAIDLETEQAFLGRSISEAGNLAGLPEIDHRFHFIRIGFAAAVRM
jgi:hypothetical protein